MADKLIVVERDRFRLTLWQKPEERDDATWEKLRGWTVAVGAAGYNTPRGVYRIVNEIRDPSWTMPDSPWVPEEQRGNVIPGGDPRNPLKEIWLGFSPEDGVGIHGTGDRDSMGKAASHGCVRMLPEDVLELAGVVGVGATVVVV